MALGTRPLTLGEILDRTVQLYKRNFLVFVGVSIPPTALMVLATGAVGILFASQMPDLMKTGGTPTAAGMEMLGLGMVLIFMVGAPILLAAFSLAMGASNYAVLYANRGEKVTIRGSYGYAFRRFWRHLGILFLQALLSWVVPYAVFIGVVTVGAILAALLGKSGAGDVLAPLLVVLFVLLILVLVVVAVWLWLRFSLAFPVSVAEDSGAWASMMRSGNLSKGTRWRILAMFLLVWALSVVATYALMIPLFIVMAIVMAATMQKSLAGPNPPIALFVGMEAVVLGISFLVRAFVMPVYITSLMLFYFDQRTRQEGFDIEQLMSQAGWTELPAPAASAPPQYAPPPYAAPVYEASSVPLTPAPPFAAPFPAENPQMDPGPTLSQSDPQPPAPEDTRE